MDRSRPGVLVVGPFRSGTSLVCRLLHELGVDFGPGSALVPADRYNPTGYFERRDVNHVNGRLLESAGRTFAEPGSPETLGADGDLAELDGADLSWTRGAARWGLKDPRFCATLHAWLEAGRLAPSSLRIVEVTRDVDAATASSLRCPWVSHFFDDDPLHVRAGVETYRDLARRQVERARVPSAIVAYEELCADPPRVVASLASLVEVDDLRSIRAAADLVGRRRARVRHLARRMRRRLRLPEPSRRVAA